MTALAEPPLALYEVELDPANEMDPAERTRLARQRHAEAVREAEAELADSATVAELAPDDWRLPAIVARVVAAAEPGTSPVLIVAAAQLVDGILEACAQSNIRECDVVQFVDLPVIALRSVAEWWRHAPERIWE